MEEIASCFTLGVFLMLCDCYCSVALPHGAVGWSAVCDCGISLIYSFTLLAVIKQKVDLDFNFLW